MHKTSQNIKQKISSFIDSLQLNETKSLSLKVGQLRQATQKMIDGEQSSIQLKNRIQVNLPQVTIQKYKRLIQKRQKNENLIKIIEKGKQITQCMQIFLRQNGNNLEITYQNFIKTIETIASFQELLNSNLKIDLNLNTLRQQFYIKMLGKIDIYKQKFQQKTSNKFISLIEKNGLPLKKQDIKKQKPQQEDIIQLLAYLNEQTCLLNLQAYLYIKLQKQQIKNEVSLFSEYWCQTIRMIQYLFVKKEELRNVQQPTWMFEYIQHTLNTNYKYFLQLLHDAKINKDIKNSISQQFLKTSYHNLILKLIDIRFKEDLPSLNQFLLFNFIDQLYQFQQKITASFTLRPSFVQFILIKYQQKNVLEKVLHFQENWFNKKIIQDFAKIDYSKVNLKNLDAFNIVINFLSLFQKLYRKYAHLKNQALLKKIIQFYHKQILNIIAHVKTSFDRIYNYSKYAKIDVLLSFKRVENQLRSNLTQFLAIDRQLEQNLQKQYYSFLAKYFQACALQTVTPIHKKLHISLGQILHQFSLDQQSKHHEYLNSFMAIYNQWNAKMEQIMKFNPYQDNKIRIIFFTYLQATNFNPLGLNLFLKIFQPYLKTLFSDDRYRLLIHLITIDKAYLDQYFQSHSGSLSFLSSQQKKQIKTFKKNLIAVEL